MSRPLLLDGCCCEGGCSIGYHRAGFDVVGVDIERQPRYPFEFVQADILNLPFDLDEFDVVHVSPPCQFYSITKHSHSKQHPDLVGPVLDMLREWGGTWVVENVVGAPLPDAIEVCGAAMGCTAEDVDGVPLVLRRHRLFASNVALLNMPCQCKVYRARGIRVGGVYGGGPSNRAISTRDLKTFRGGYTPTKSVRADLIGVNHMTMHGLAQAIPPAYTEFIGAQLMQHVRTTA